MLMIGHGCTRALCHQQRRMAKLVFKNDVKARGLAKCEVVEKLRSVSTRGQRNDLDCVALLLSDAIPACGHTSSPRSLYRESRR